MNDVFRAGTTDIQRGWLRARLLDETLRKKSEGASIADVIVMLHDEGLSIVESMWVVRQAYELPLDQVKDLVSAHPIWELIVRAAEPLHEELEKLAAEESAE